MTIQTTEIKEHKTSDHSDEGFTDSATWFKCPCGEDMTIVDFESEDCEKCKRRFSYDKGKVFCDETMMAYCKNCKEDVEYNIHGWCPNKGCDETVAEVEE